jgi:hypothetical protein
MNTPMIAQWITNGLAFGSVSAQNSPTSYAATGLPPGVVLNATTGVFSGRPIASGTYTVQFTGTNLAGTGPPLNYPVTVQPAVVGEIGNFAGLVNRDVSGNGSLGGGVSFTLTNAGTGTGKLTHLGVVYSVTVALSAAPGTTRTLTFTPPAGTKNFPPMAATLTSATGDVTGTVNGVAFTASRNPWTAVNPPPAAQVGRFNVAFNVDNALVGNASYPQGCGYGSLVIDALGNVTWTGKLSDGSVTTATSLLSSTGAVVLHQALYAVGTGSAQGTLAVAGDGSVSTTGFDWVKNAQTVATRSYMNGFPLHNLTVVGGTYVKPAANVQVIGLAGSTNNAQLVLSQAGLASPLTQLLNFPATNVITVPAPNPNTVKIATLDLTTGLFTGSFVIPDALPANVRTTSFYGLLLQGTHEGRGCFNLAQLPNPTTSAQLSGRLVLAAPGT